MVADVRVDPGPQHRHALLQRAPAQVGLLGRDPLWQDGQLVHQPGRKSNELLGLAIKFKFGHAFFMDQCSIQSYAISPLAR